MRLIDADAFCEKWKEVRKSEYLDDFARGYQAGIFAMDAAPTVDAELVKHGHWEMVEERKLDDAGDVVRTSKMIPMCSACRHADKDFRIYFPRCPDCGAIMDEEYNNEKEN